MEQLLQVVAVIVVVLAVGWVVARFVSVVTVRDYERGLRFSRGHLTGVTGSGVHVSVRPFTEIHVLDGRPTALIVEGQEVMTADGVPLKVSLAARYVVGDAVAATLGDTDFRRAMHLMLQLTLRDLLAGRTVEDALAARHELGPAIRERCASDLATLGIELLAVEARDLMVPGELKRAFAGIIAARKEGEAALERARGETAALRNLANAGRMVEDNPGLLQLRMLQQIGGSTGNTVMLGMPDASVAPGSNASAGGVAAAVRRPRRVSPSLPAQVDTDGV